MDDTKSAIAIARSVLSAPRTSTVCWTNRPPTVAPSVAPLPMKPKRRLASRVVTT